MSSLNRSFSRVVQEVKRELGGKEAVFPLPVPDTKFKGQLATSLSWKVPDRVMETLRAFEAVAVKTNNLLKKERGDLRFLNPIGFKDEPASRFWQEKAGYVGVKVIPTGVVDKVSGQRVAFAVKTAGSLISPQVKTLGVTCYLMKEGETVSNPHVVKGSLAQARRQFVGYLKAQYN